MKFLIASLLVLSIAIGVNGRKWANDVRHGPCVTNDGTPHDLQENWILAFARAQKDLANNPSKAKYGDDWPATIAAYPFLQTQLKVVIADLKSNMDFEKVKYKNINMSLPYTRVCVVSAKGIKAGLKKDDYNIHFNPTGTATDLTATLFFKAFIRNGRVWMGLGIGQALH